MKQGIDKRAIVRTLEEEITKEYTVFDGSGRVSEFYQAQSDAENGDPCLKTTYSYHATYTTQVFKRKEEMSSWNSSWDI